MHLRILKLAFAAAALTAVAFAQNPPGPVLAPTTLSALGVAGGAVMNPGILLDAFQVHYLANLNIGDGIINITNTGALGADFFGPLSGTTGNICVNVYAFSADEQEVACCQCLVTPNALVHISAGTDLIANTLTGVVPKSLMVKLLATVPGPGTNSGVPGSNGANGTLPGAGVVGGVLQGFVGRACNAAYPFNIQNLAPGMRAWATVLHALSPAAFPVATTPPGSTVYGVTEGAFLPAVLSPGELSKMTQLCQFISGNGSGAGVCKGCTLGGLGAHPANGL